MTDKQVSSVYWLLPVLMGMLGGIIYYFVVRDMNEARARTGFYLGVLISAIPLAALFILSLPMLIR